MHEIELCSLSTQLTYTMEEKRRTFLQDVKYNVKKCRLGTGKGSSPLKKSLLTFFV